MYIWLPHILLYNVYMITSYTFIYLRISYTFTSLCKNYKNKFSKNYKKTIKINSAKITKKL